MTTTQNPLQLFLEEAVNQGFSVIGSERGLQRLAWTTRTVGPVVELVGRAPEWLAPTRAAIEVERWASLLGLIVTTDDEGAFDGYAGSCGHIEVSLHPW